MEETKLKKASRLKSSTFTRGAITKQLYDKIVSTIKGNEDVADFRKTNRNFLFIDGNLQNPFFFFGPKKEGEEAGLKSEKLCFEKST